MIGRLPGRVVVLGIIGFVVVISALGAMSIRRVEAPGPYLLALALGLASVVAVLLRWPAGRERLVAVGVLLAVVAIGPLVVLVLPDGRPGYALWFPAFVWLPLSGLALRGHVVLALTGAGLSAATTMFWAWRAPDVGLEDGVYRVVSPTAVVVVAAGIAILVRQYGQEVERAHAEQLEASRLAAGARAAEQERRTRLAQVEQIAAPVLLRLRDGDRVDERLRTECRLLEAALRDGIRGRHLVDPAVRETLWAARTRGVEVTLLDDSGTGAGAPPAVGALVRRCTVELVERLEQGSVTVRLSSPEEGTVVVLAPGAAALAEACCAVREGEHVAAAPQDATAPGATSSGGADAAHRVLLVERHAEADDEVLVVIRAVRRPTTPPPATRGATAPAPA